MKQVRAKKQLGQHFLRSHTVVQKIIEVSGLTKEDTVLEIGPGAGFLTEALLQAGAQVIAVEKDFELIQLLTEKFAHEIAQGRLILIQKDILLFTPEEHALISGGYKVIANIPYYITGEILRKFLSGAVQPERMILLVQKEVAERIVARDTRESILSISVKAYGKPRIVKHVPKKLFTPPPKVDSSVLAISHISRASFIGVDESLFFSLVKLGFGQKRKKLISNLSSHVDKQMLISLFFERKLADSLRPENLTISDWLWLTHKIQEFQLSLK